MQQTTQWIFAFLFFQSVLIAIPARAISRVGPSEIGDRSLGFSAQVPLEYSEITNEPNDSVNLHLLGLGIDSVVSPLRPISVFPLYYEYRNIQSMGRATLENLIVSDGSKWKAETVSDPCVLALSTTKGNTHIVVATWGGGKGVFISSDAEPLALSGDDTLLLSLVLAPGACAW